MNRMIHCISFALLTGLLALQPLYSAGPLVVFAEELVESGRYIEGEGEDDTKYDWTIYKDNGEYRLVVEGNGEFNYSGDSFYEDEANIYYLIDTATDKVSETSLNQISVFEIRGMISFDDSSFSGPDNINDTLKKIIIDDKLQFIYHSYEFEALDTIEIDSNNPYLKMDGHTVIENGSSLLWYIPNGETEYYVKEGIKRIKSGAFYFAGSLTSVSLPSTLETIEKDAFWGCKNIKKIHIPASVVQLGDTPEMNIDDVTAFIDMDGLEEITVDPANTVYSAKDGILFSKDKTVLCYFPSSKKTDNNRYTVPSTVKKLSMHAFSDNYKMKYIIIPKTLKKIVYYKDGDNPCESHVFSYAEGEVLYEGTIEEWDQLFDGYSEAYDHYNYSFPLIRVNSTDPDVIDKSLEEGKFLGYSWKLTGSEGDYTLTVTGEADEYGDYPDFKAYFFEKEKLYYLLDSQTGSFSVVSLDKIKHAVFKDISDVILDCFVGEDEETNNKLESISLPKTMDSLTNCCCLHKLKTITVENGNPEYYVEDGILFSDYGESEKNLHLYPAASTASSYTLPNDIKRIKTYAFAGNTSLTEIKLNEGLEMIENAAFFGCTGLTGIELPSTFEAAFDEYDHYRVDSFLHMPSLQKISVSDKNPDFSSVDGILFSKDGKLLCFYPEARKESNNCYYIPSNVEILGLYAFCGAGIDSVFIPKSVTKINHDDYDGLYWYELFYNSSIKTVYYEGTAEEWDKLINAEKLDPECHLPNVEYGSKGPAIIDASYNLPMDYTFKERGDYKFYYNYSIPFFGKAKPRLDFFGEEGIKVVCNNEEYMASKVKINKKKKLITVIALKKADGSDAEKDIVKLVKKATKGKNGLEFNINPYYVKDDTKLEPKKKKDGDLKSIKIEIKEKLYKAKNNEFTYDKDSDTVTFDSENLKGSRKLS